MSCAPFRIERSMMRLPSFPSEGECQALRGDAEHPDCCCRAYPGRGFYVVGHCGHAHGYALLEPDAMAYCTRLNLVPVDAPQEAS